ncbi:MAG: S9 family peptidase [Chitinophagaceae bacterium]|nr:S9 family peptidase [Chitinophagaceae bacterium]
MKILLPLFALLLVFSCKQNPQPPKIVKQYTIEEFYKTKRISGGAFSPDEKMLLVSNDETGIFNAWEIPVDGSSPRQLTSSSTNSVFAISYLPADNRILYRSDQGGNEIGHIYLRKEDGSTMDLTPDSAAKAEFVQWSRDKKSFLYLSNKRDPRFMDLYELEISEFTPKLIYRNDSGLDVSAISNSKRFVALSKTVTTANSDIYLYDLMDKKMKLITSHEGDVSNGALFFSNDEKWLYYTTDEGSEYAYLVRYNLADEKLEKVYETNWDVAYAYDSYNEKYRVILVNEDGKNAIQVIDLQSNQPVKLPEFKDLDILSVNISESERLMRLQSGSSVSPANMYVYNFETKELKQLTNTANPEINSADLSPATVVRFASFDGQSIPAIYYKPVVASKDNKVPALVWVHGGPGGQSRIGYSAFIQYLVNHGYAVLMVNNRGSSGYGKTFFKMDDRDHGGKDLKDCIAGKDWLATQEYIDSGKIGIIGGSYGGFMVLAALAFTPDQFKVGVDLFGVSNWLRTLKSVPPYWESFRKALYDEMGDPATADSVMLYNTSPLFHASNIVRPLMVLQGANDPRVLKVESDEVVEAVKKNNVPVEYVVFPDEGHGFVKKENEMKGYRQVLQFLDTHLKGMEVRAATGDSIKAN